MSNPDRQREHQANERTFLAWLRTSIALISFGFAIARFGLFLQEFQTSLHPPTSQAEPSVLAQFLGVGSSQLLGVGLAVVGVVVIALAAWRYNRVYQQIESGDYRPNRLLIWGIAAVVMVLGLLSLPLVLWRQNAPVRHTSPALPRSPAKPSGSAQ